MTDRSRFLCGCPVEPRPGYGDRAVAYTDGIRVCPEHGQPENGFLSPLKVHESGHEVLDYRKVGASNKKFIPKPTSENRRDNRDPEAIGHILLTRWHDKQAQKMPISMVADISLNGDGQAV